MWCLVPGNMIVRVASKNRPGYYWAIDEGIEGYLMTEAEMFRLVSPGLAPRTVQPRVILTPGVVLIRLILASPFGCIVILPGTQVQSLK